MADLLIIDDDRELCAMLKDYLEPLGFRLHGVHDGLSGVEQALGGGFALVILDLMLPGIDGLEALRRIRAQSMVPVLMLTARGDEVDRIVGLELGADDYLPKPFNPRELSARVRAILRRQEVADGPEPPARVQVGDLEIDPARRIAKQNGRPLSLTSTEFSLLEVLAMRAGRVVSKAELSEQALGRPLGRYDRSIDMHLSNLRRKLAPCSDGRSLIETVRGMGYQLVVDGG